MKKQKPTIDELFATLPELPKGFKEGCKKYIKGAPIYYKRKGNRANCICGECGGTYEVKGRVERFEGTECQICGKVGRYEWQRCSAPVWDYYTVILIQKRTDGNLVARHFKCENKYEMGVPRFFFLEEKNRYFFDLGDFYKFNCQGHLFWTTGPTGITYGDFLYPGYEEEIKDSNFRYFEQSKNGIIPCLKAYSRNPGIEMFRKMGLERLCNDLEYKEGRSKLINRRGKTAKAQLRLTNKASINQLRRINGGLNDLQILQLEEKWKIRLEDDEVKTIRGIFGQWGGERKFYNMLELMTVRQLLNRIKKYKEQEANKWYTSVAAFNVYYDYIEMRKELGYDISNEVFVHPKNLKEKHDEMVTEKNARADALFKAKSEAQYPGINERYEKLCEKYGFEKDGFVIRPAKNASEIIDEGRTLHHCVGRGGYIQKHNKGETFILFLRKSETADIPYYTIEIKGTDILQWYGAHDKKPDREAISKWLNDYIKSIGGKKKVA